MTEQGWQSPIAKFFDAELIADLNRSQGADVGDLWLFAADSFDTVKASLGILRLGRAKLYDPLALTSYG